MLMGIFHQQKLQYWAHREYKNPVFYGITGLGFPHCSLSYASITSMYLLILYLSSIYTSILELYFKSWRMYHDSREVQRKIVPDLQLKASLHLPWVKSASKSIPSSLVIYLVIYLLIDWKIIEWVRVHEKILLQYYHRFHLIFIFKHGCMEILSTRMEALTA